MCWAGKRGPQIALFVGCIRNSFLKEHLETDETQQERQRESISVDEAKAGSAEVRQKVKVSVPKQLSIIWLKCRLCVEVS